MPDLYQTNTDTVCAFVLRCSHIPMGPVNGSRDMREAFAHAHSTITNAAEVMGAGASNLAPELMGLLADVNSIEDLDGTVDWGAVCDAYDQRGTCKRLEDLLDEGLNAYVKVGDTDLVTIDRSCAYKRLGGLSAMPVSNEYRAHYRGLTIVVD